MNKIDLQFSAILKDRFYNCDDGIIMNVNISFEDLGSYPSVLLKIDTQDELSSTSWSTLYLKLTGVTDIRFLEEWKCTYRVLSHGVIFTYKEGFYEINFEDTEVSKSHSYFRFTEGEWYVE